jgi:hypothetical protein
MPKLRLSSKALKGATKQSNPMPTLAGKSLDRGPDKWQAQEDAHALARAVEIQSDRKRFGAAKKEAATMAKESQTKAQNLMNIAKRGK